jgi:hypothetical protein
MSERRQAEDSRCRFGLRIPLGYEGKESLKWSEWKVDVS